jgi:hypothetical protein
MTTTAEPTKAVTLSPDQFFAWLHAELDKAKNEAEGAGLARMEHASKQMTVAKAFWNVPSNKDALAFEMISSYAPFGGTQEPLTSKSDQQVFEMTPGQTSLHTTGAKPAGPSLPSGNVVKQQITWPLDLAAEAKAEAQAATDVQKNATGADDLHWGRDAKVEGT